MKIYIENLDTTWNEQNLKDLFSTYGTVASATVVMDVFTERSRGFGYVAMHDEAEATTAIESLNGTEVGNKVLAVKLAEPEKARSGSYKIGNSGNPYRFRKQ